MTVSPALALIWNALLLSATPEPIVALDIQRPGACDSACAERMAVLAAQAQELAAHSAHAGAILLYEQVMRDAPMTTFSQEAAIKAAESAKAAGQRERAVALYESALETGRKIGFKDTRKWPELQRLKALMQIEAAMQTPGEPRATEILQRVAAEHAGSLQGNRAVLELARSAGKDTTLPERLCQEELAASKRLPEATSLRQEGSDVARAIQKLDEVIAVAPLGQTSIRAINEKLRILPTTTPPDDPFWEMAGRTYDTVLERWGTNTPTPRVVYDARLGAMKLLARTLMDGHKGSALGPDPAWERLRVKALEVITQDPRPVDRAGAYLLICESLVWERRFEESLQMAQEGNRRLDGLIAFQQVNAWIHLSAAVSLHALKRYPEALQEYQITRDLGESDKGLMKEVLCRRWMALRSSEAPQTESDAAAAEFLESFADTDYAAYVSR